MPPQVPAAGPGLLTCTVEAVGAVHEDVLWWAAAQLLLALVLEDLEAELVDHLRLRNLASAATPDLFV